MLLRIVDHRSSIIDLRSSIVDLRCPRAVSFPKNAFSPASGIQAAALANSSAAGRDARGRLWRRSLAPIFFVSEPKKNPSFFPRLKTKPSGAKWLSGHKTPKRGGQGFPKI
jgi:hypothetical protein